MDETDQPTTNNNNPSSQNDEVTDISTKEDMNIGQPEPEVIDLSSSDEDDHGNEDPLYRGCFDYDAMDLDVSDYEPFLLEWDTDPEKFPLYWSNPDFKAYVSPYLDLMKDYGVECALMCYRSYHRMPTVDEFFYYVMSKRISRIDWVGRWEVVNPDRRGWPLQYMEKADIKVKGITFSSPFAEPKIGLKIIKVHDPKLKNIPKLDEINLWEIVPLHNSHVSCVEKEKNVLQLIRTFHELIDVTAESEVVTINSFFNITLYQRMELLFNMENPRNGGISSYDRNRIMNAIKYHHLLRNRMQEIHLQMLDNPELVSLDDEGQEIESIKSSESETTEEVEQHVSKYVFMQMQIDRHKLELNFLLKPTLRPLINSLPAYGTDEACANYENILIVKDASITDLDEILNNIKEIQQADFLKDFNSRSKMKICSDLEIALKSCVKGANIFLTSGNHYVSSLHNLSDGGSLIGIKIGDADVAVCPANDVGDIWLLIDGSHESKLIFKNIDFVIGANDDNNQLTAFQITSGNLIMEKCMFRDLRVNKDKAMAPQAKKAENAIVLMMDCNFEFTNN